MPYDFLPTYPGVEATPDPSVLFDALWAAPLSTRGFVRFDRELGTIEFVGIQHSTAVVLGAQMVPGLGLTLTTRRSAGHHWAARGVRGSHPASVETILLRDPVEGRSEPRRYVLLSHSELGKNDEERYSHSRGVMEFNQL